MNNQAYSLDEIQKKILEARKKVHRFEHTAKIVLDSQIKELDAQEGDGPEPDGLGRIFI